MPEAAKAFRCPKCEQLLPLTLEYWHHDGRRSNGFRPYCRTCTREDIRDREQRRLAAAGAPPMQPKSEPSTPLTAEQLVAREQAVEAERGARREVKVLTEELRRARAALADMAGLQATPPPQVIRAPRPVKGEAVPIILASDWHVEEVVERGKVQGLNEYNPAIAKKRAEAFFVNALRLVERDAAYSTIRRVVVGWLGDWITGHIHDGYKAVNAMHPVTAMSYWRGLAANGIRYWLSNSKVSWDFVMLPGNHDRTTDRMQSESSFETSHATQAHHWLRQEFEGEKRIRWHMPTSDVQYLDVFPTYRARFIHGWQIQYQGGVGGVTIPLTKWSLRSNLAVPAQLTCLGHFHQLQSPPGILLNGSLIGWNNYAQSKGFAFEPPGQAYGLIHSRHGGVLTSVSRIWVDP